MAVVPTAANHQRVSSPTERPISTTLLRDEHPADFVMESSESGKPIRDCETIDIPEAIDTIKWHADLIDKVYDKAAPVGDDAMAIIVREPVGVVGVVIPWKFPLLLAAWKIGPAPAPGW